jgi:sugar phosphate isomerase/epimerase
MKYGMRNFGVSMGLCAGNIEQYFKYLQIEDISTVCLRVLEDFTEFVLGNDFEVIEMGAPNIVPAESLISVAGDIKKGVSQFRVVNYHLPFGELNIASFHTGIRKVAVEETKRCIDLCQQIGVNKVTMHPGNFLAMPDGYLQMKELARAIAENSILEIFHYCRSKNIELALENLPRNNALFQKPEEFETLVEKGIGLVLDTVHAYVSNVEPIDFIRKFGAGITSVHLTDGVKNNPIDHYPLGTGEVDCIGILNELQKVHFDGEIILEVNSREDLIKSKEFLERNSYMQPSCSIPMRQLK